MAATPPPQTPAPVAGAGAGAEAEAEALAEQVAAVEIKEAPAAEAPAAEAEAPAAPQEPVTYGRVLEDGRQSFTVEELKQMRGFCPSELDESSTFSAILKGMFENQFAKLYVKNAGANQGGRGGGGGGGNWARGGNRNGPSPRGGPGGFDGPSPRGGGMQGQWEDHRGGGGGGRRNRGGDRRGGGGGYQQGGGGYGNPGWRGEPVVLHKTDNAFKLGQVRTDDPEEENRQKAFKSILNKLTPENFDRLVPKLLGVEIPRRTTLEGLVDQIFDKSLMETTFCELYSRLCRAMQHSHCLPHFDRTGEAVPADVAAKMDPEERKTLSDFRKMLLNKCQAEYQAGLKAQEEHFKDTHPEGAAAAEEASGEDAAAKREREKANLQARKRMLGNIQFIGHLFHQGLLIEKIMHACVRQLLEHVEDPEPEDVEALCKLLTTIGDKIDTTPNEKVMSVYFSRIGKLRQNEKLESRIRFMLQDLIDLRDRGWAHRRKVEGPKKIHEVHADAMRGQPRQGGPPGRGGFDDRRGGGGFDDRRGGGFGGRGGRDDRGNFGGGFDRRGGGGFDDRRGGGGFDDRRGGGGFDDRRGGGFGGPPRDDRFGGRDMRSQSSHAPAPPPRRVEAAESPRRDAAPARAEPAAKAAPSAAPAFDAEALRNKARCVLEEYESGGAKPSELLVDYKEVTGKGARGGAFLAAVAREGMTGKGRSWDKCQELLLAVAAQHGDDVGAAAWDEAVGELVDTLADATEERTNCPALLGGLVATLAAGHGVDAGKALLGVLTAGDDPFEEGEDYGLVDSGHGAEFVAATVAALAEADEARARGAWAQAGRALADFLPGFERDDAASKIAGLLDKYPAAKAVLG